MAEHAKQVHVQLVPMQQVQHEETPFIGTETGLLSLILPCVVLLVALGSLLRDEGQSE